MVLQQECRKEILKIKLELDLKQSLSERLVCTLVLRGEEGQHEPVLVMGKVNFREHKLYMRIDEMRA
jgi:hypothetical protein